MWVVFLINESFGKIQLTEDSVAPVVCFLMGGKKKQIEQTSNQRFFMVSASDPASLPSMIHFDWYLQAKIIISSANCFWPWCFM